MLVCYNCGRDTRINLEFYFYGVCSIYALPELTDVLCYEWPNGKC